MQLKTARKAPHVPTDEALPQKAEIHRPDKKQPLPGTASPNKKVAKNENMEIECQVNLVKYCKVFFLPFHSIKTKRLCITQSLLSEIPVAGFNFSLLHDPSFWRSPPLYSQIL